MRRAARPHLLLSTGLATLVAAAGCASEQDGDILEVTCPSGKCDAFDSLRSFFDDASSVDLGDLLHVGASLATDGLNDALEIGDFEALEITAPQAYALNRDAQDDLTLESIDELVDGLARRFGEKNLTVEVNRLRREHLKSSGKKFYGEAAFKVGPQFKPSWNIEVGGLGEAFVRVGFEVAATIEARTITAFEDEPDVFLKGPLKAAKEFRGFVFPKSADDVLDMEPGESFALNGAGALGINVGAGVPILIADPGDISYQLVISAALRARLAGDLDVQLVRMGGNDVVVDVGMEKVRGTFFQLALEDGWGVAGLVKAKVNIGPIDIDLGRLAEKGLERLMNRKLELIDATIERETIRARVSVARFRFTLKKGDNQGLAATAMAQALKGDVRLAQALANRKSPGVIAEFDLSRSGVSTRSFAGIDILGMSFYKGSTSTEGTSVVQTPAGSMSLFFESLHRESGWFFTSHGLLRLGLAGLTLDSDSPDKPRGETNLILNLMEGDDFMESDKMLDHLDGILFATAGEQAVKALEVSANKITRFVNDECKPPNPLDKQAPLAEQEFRQCRVDVQEDPRVLELKADAMVAFDRATGSLSGGVKGFVTRIAEERIRVQTVRENNALLTGPSSSFVVDYRLDDATLKDILMNRDGHALAASIIDYLEFTEVNRDDDADDIEGDRKDIRDDTETDKVREAFDKGARKFKRLVGAEEAEIEILGNVGERAIEIRFPVDSKNRPIYEKAVAQSIAQARMEVVNEMFDDIEDEAEGHRGAHIATYGLLSLTAPDHLDLRVDFDTDVEGNDPFEAAGFANYDVYLKGPAAQPIDAAMFDLTKLSRIDK